MVQVPQGLLPTTNLCEIELSFFIMEVVPDSLFLGGVSNRESKFNEVLELAFREQSSFWRANLGYAYVSSLGLQNLKKAASGIDAWESTGRDWIIGLHHGITEPKALEDLLDSENDNPRVFIPKRFMKKPTPTIELLCSEEKFHAKMVSVRKVESGQLTCLVTSSANLTGAAISDSPLNYEAGVALFSKQILTQLNQGIDEWWHRCRQSTIEVTSSFIDSYSTVREELLESFPLLKGSLDPPPTGWQRIANCFWIQAGSMDGASRNGLGIPAELVEFFGEDAGSGVIPFSVIVKGKSFHLEFKDRGALTWSRVFRSYLPTEKKCGLLYPGNIILFKKVNECQFELQTIVDGSQDAKELRIETHRRGYYGTTSGVGEKSGREYGFWPAL